jgi:hypothetical protein
VFAPFSHVESFLLKATVDAKFERSSKLAVFFFAGGHLLSKGETITGHQHAPFSR